jgi:predicted RNA binding protein YcfA (HicA-like mRNA interferase family)
MTKLPIVSSRVCIKALERIGFKVIRQRGSHIMMVRDETDTQVVVPNHKEIAIGTLRRIIRDIGLTVEEFKELL